MDVLEQEMKQPDVANDAVHYSLLQTRLNELRVKYDNAQAEADNSRARAQDLQRAFNECPEDGLHQRQGNNAAQQRQHQATKRALTMAANAVADLTEFLTPR